MKCLHSLTRHNPTSILLSIHQPNNDLFLMFDTIHVLSKGFCLFSGRPHELKHYLSEYDINCKENEIPIEVLLKISSNDCTDNRIQQMIDKTLEVNKSTNSRIDTKTKNYNFKTNSKHLCAKDIYYLSMRRICTHFTCQWKTLFIESLFHVIFTLILTNAINESHWKFNGCFTYSSNSTINCVDKEQQKLITEQTVFLIYLTSFIFMLTIISITTKNFCTEIHGFLYEIRNGIYIFK